MPNRATMQELQQRIEAFERSGNFADGVLLLALTPVDRGTEEAPDYVVAQTALARTYVSPTVHGDGDTAVRDLGRSTQQQLQAIQQGKVSEAERPDAPG